MKRLYTRLKDTIIKIPLMSFFLVSFVISWTVWAISPVVTHDPDIARLINMLGAFGPALAAVALSKIVDNVPAGARPNKYWVCFAVLFASAYALNILSLDTLLGMPASPAAMIILGIIALVAARVMVGLLFPKNNFIRRTGFVWYFAAVLLLPLLQLLSVGIDLLLAGTFDTTFYKPMFIPSALSGYLAILVFGGSLNEEPGWRGFALPRLLERFSPLMASLVLGVIWSLWHAPLHFNGFYADGLAGFLTRFIWNVPLTIFFTWLYIQTKGSLLHVILLHTSINTVGLWLPLSARASVFLIVMSVLLLIIFVLRTRMWEKRIWH